MHKFTAPLYLITAKSGKGRKYYLNLNQYRNWKGIVSNTVKKKYKEVLSSQLIGKTFKTPIMLTFISIRGDKRRIDRANALSIHEKFFCDALVELGCIPDDNDLFITRTTYESGPIDKGNGRVEIIITEL